MAKTLPKVYYGLHMEPGVAEYREPGQNPYRILVDEGAIKNMDPTFKGRPVYVYHVDQVDLENLQTEADGYVIRSFYNAMDGKHWVEFIVVSDKGHEAIRSGWKLSNAYIPKEMAQGGLWHGVQYDKQVMNAEYEHLAIVSNPRYENSVILTPEQFKEYNSEKELELKRLANSKGDQSMFKFFKKAAVENSADLEGMSVQLPKSKREGTVSQFLNEMDDYTLKMKEPQMANGDHKVKVGEDEMTVNDLISKHLEMKKKMDAMGDDVADVDAKLSEGKGEGELVPNEDEEEEMNEGEMSEKEALEKKNLEQKKSNEADEAAKQAETERRAEAKKKAAALRNAEGDAIRALRNAPRVETSVDQVARGKSRYGTAV